jgi:hypothetical protein
MRVVAHLQTLLTVDFLNSIILALVVLADVGDFVLQAAAERSFIGEESHLMNDGYLVLSHSSFYY